MWRQKLFVAFGLLVGVFAVPLLAPEASAQQFSYTITDLGPASVPGLAGATWMGSIYTGGTYTLGINAAGDVVGVSPSASGNCHAALFRNGQVIDLGTLGGLISEASAINKSGLIVGNSQIASGSVHAFLYSNNVMTDLGTLGGANSYATAINDVGQIVGRSEMSDGTTHAFLYAAGVMTDLGAGAASSINSTPMARCKLSPNCRALPANSRAARPTLSTIAVRSSAIPCARVDGRSGATGLCRSREGKRRMSSLPASSTAPPSQSMRRGTSSARLYHIATAELAKKTSHFLMGPSFWRGIWPLPALAGSG